MQRQRRKTKNLVIIFALIIACLYVGYSIITSNLQVRTSLDVAKTSFDVHFENVRINEESTIETQPTLSNDQTKLTFSITLSAPGDSYIINADICNAGTMDAAINELSIAGINETYASSELFYTSDENSVSENDLIKVGSSEEIEFAVKYNYDDSSSEAILLNEPITMNIELNINYVKADDEALKNGVYNIRPYSFLPSLLGDAVLDNIKSKYVSSDDGIDFSHKSSDTNGKGLYIASATANDNNPVIYYRGDVDNNNIKYMNYCWKIVRTTSTGGLKLIYNGLPNEDGYCSNNDSSTTTIAYSTFYNTSNVNTPSFTGYMTGYSIYPYSSKTIESSYYYGNSIQFIDVDSNVQGDGEYTISNLTNNSNNISNNHYTCFNSTGKCSELAYIYYVDSSSNKAYYVTLKDGEKIEDTLNNMKLNEENSEIKYNIDYWFKQAIEEIYTSNELNYNDYIEDTVWCNDRTMATNTNGWISNGGNVQEFLYYSGYKRREEGTPSLTCQQKSDSFTSNDTINGNGALQYPIGLLTSDEVILAGGSSEEDNNFYLRNNGSYWTMTPYYFEKNYGGMFGVYGTGKLDYHGIGDSKGVRPAISIRLDNIKIDSGDGTVENPYHVQGSDLEYIEEEPETGGVQ